MSKNSKILVTGATGQIGSELVPKLRKIYDEESVVAGKHNRAPSGDLMNGPIEKVDVTSKSEIESIVKEYNIDIIFHMAALLSGVGEQNPWRAWDVNVNGTYNILEIAREHNVKKVFCPSSIAVFGPETPKLSTPQETILKPRTMYGVTKVTGELLTNYYFEKFGLDVRGCRYPGIISNKTPPGGGTTDYAVEIFYHALKYKKYECFLKPETTLPMMYMPDCINATIQLMNSPLKNLKHRTDYNLSAISFNPQELVNEISKHIPNFVVTYKPDYRQAIAESWPKTIDDSAARDEWGWNPSFNLEMMVEDMIQVLSSRTI
jgi:nucleoside-diphosphate-sugar epimerase